MNYQDINAATIDRWVEEGWEWGKPISHETYENAKNGTWDVLLTPTIPVPHEWFGDMSGKKLLGLASGGGQQMPIFAARGAICTVLDYSPKQLESERMVSQREGYDIDIIRADMTKPLPFPDETFDIIFLDPPYAEIFLENALKCITEIDILRSGGIIVTERPLDKELSLDFPGYSRSRDYKYGKTLITLYRREDPQGEQE